MYPFFNVFYLHSYDQPRFLRFWNQGLIILMTLLLSILPYYNTTFEEKYVFMDERDINEEELSIDNLPFKLSDVSYII